MGISSDFFVIERRLKSDDPQRFVIFVRAYVGIGAVVSCAAAAAAAAW